jgi:hypothetical protein
MKNLAFFFRSLPNWLNLKASSSPSSAVTEDETEDQMMSEDELRMMNAKESSILTSNLSTSESHVASSEIISDITLLRALGHLCESMVGTVLICSTYLHIHVNMFLKEKIQCYRKQLEGFDRRKYMLIRVEFCAEMTVV